MNEPAPSTAASESTCKSRRASYLLTAFFAALLFTPIIWKLSGSAYDYVVHTRLAAQMATSLTLLSPHFLLQAVIVLLKQIFQTSFSTSCYLAVILPIAAAAALLFSRMYTATDKSVLSGFLAMGLLLVAPLPLLAPLDGHQYLGYIGINVLHNPTILLLKPFALLLFTFATTRIVEAAAINRSRLTVCIMVTIACALTKPSYIIVLLPTLAIAICVPAIRKSLANPIFILCGILIPGALILAWQYWITYSAQQMSGVYAGKSSIIFAPLVVMSYFSSWLLIKFLLSIAFPLAVVAGHFRQVLADGRLCFAWLAFVIGSAYTYFLAESGPRMLQGNFTWSGQIALFILFVTSLEFLYEQQRHNVRNNRSHKFVFTLCSTFFVLHILSGVAFYAAEFIANERYW